MMDDLLNLDFNFLDDDLLSFPMDDHFPIESREIESILNEIEQTTNEKLFNVNSAFNQFTSSHRPTIMFNTRNGLKTNKKTKSKIGTSLLAKPPKKLKKDKNSLLRNSVVANSLLIGQKQSSNVAICQATFTAYFYQDHNYCFNTRKLQSEQPFNRQQQQSIVDLNNNQSEDQLKFDNCLTIETKEIVIDSFSNQTMRKKNNSSSTTFNLISPNLFNNTANCDQVHDLDDFFNISFSNSEDSTSSNHSETEEDDSMHASKFDLQSELSKYETFNEINNESSSETKQKEMNDTNESTKQVKQVVVAADKEIVVIEKESPTNANVNDTIKAPSVAEIKNVLIDDLNNYNINELNSTDTENELNSLDDDEDDILIETDILIDEMFGDFEEYDLINKKSRSSKGSSNKNKINNRNVHSKSPKTVVVANTNRRARTISNSYSVRSGSSCSCCSEDMSEEEQQPKLNESITNKHQQVNKSNNKNTINRNRSTSKLIKSDNTFIRKKNNGRFLMHKI